MSDFVYRGSMCSTYLQSSVQRTLMVSFCVIPRLNKWGFELELSEQLPYYDTSFSYTVRLSAVRVEICFIPVLKENHLFYITLWSTSVCFEVFSNGMATGSRSKFSKGIVLHFQWNLNTHVAALLLE